MVSPLPLAILRATRRIAPDGRTFRRALAATTALAALLVFQKPVAAGPEGGRVISGTASISQGGAVTSIDQSSAKAIISWQSFSVGRQETVNFHQPDASAVTLNRVIGNEASVIQGAINANGQVFLVNSNGILFTSTSQVNVGGLVASTLDISNEDFISGNYVFSGASTKSVVNRGALTAKDGGYISLMGKSVSNEGVITATLGTVALTAGSKITLNFEGNSLFDVTIDKGVMDALVENRQVIKADGGKVVMTARAADAVLSSQVNNSGIVQARTMAALTGGAAPGKGYSKGSIKIKAEGGKADIKGKLDASAPNGGDGGFIETSGDKVSIDATTEITTAAARGATGTWLIDPDGFTVGAGGDITGATLTSQLASSNVTIASTQGSGTDGNITVNDAVSWSANTLTLNATHNIYVNAVMTAGGTASFAGNYGHILDASGTPTAAPASGSNADGTPFGLYTSFGVVDREGTFAGRIDFTGTGSVTLNGQAHAVINDIAGLNAIRDDLAGHYVLGGDISGQTLANWTGPIGATDTAAFTGVLNGLGHRVMNFTNLKQGVFGYVGADAAVSNVGVINTVFSFVDDFTNIGILTGNNAGSIVNSFGGGSSGALSGAIGTSVGGLVGRNTGTILNSYAAATVYANSIAGGLVGTNEGTIRNSYVRGSANTYVTGTSANISWVGGFAGLNSGDISNAYVTSEDVNGPVYLYSSAKFSGSATAGGFVGSNSSTGSISYAYVGGNKISSRRGAGFAGENAGLIDNAYVSTPLSIQVAAYKAGFTITNTGTITNSYWDRTRSGVTTDGTGSTAVAATSMGGLATLPAGFDPDHWGLSQDGHPILKTLPLYVSARASLQYGTSAADVLANVVVSGLQWGDAASTVFTYVPTAALLSGSGYLNAGIYGVGNVLHDSGAYTTVAGSIAVARRQLTLASSGIIADKTYDGTTAAIVAVTAPGDGLIGLVDSETLAVTYSNAAFADKNAQTAKQVALTVALANGSNGGIAANYEITGATTTTASIARATVTAAFDAADKVYDGTTQATVTAFGVSGLIGDDSVSVFATGHFVDANAGTGKAVTITGGGLSGAAASNYVLAGTPSFLTADIAPRAVLLQGAKPVDGSSVFDASQITVANLAAGDVVHLSGAAYARDSAPGTSELLPGGLSLDNSNYTLAGASGTAVIYSSPLPAGASVAFGNITGITTAGTVMTVTQLSRQAIINWQSFNVNQGYTVAFDQQYGASSITLNRVVGNERSIIAGAVTAPGHVYIVNSAGVLFTGTSQVNVGALVASTQDITDADFLADIFRFGGNAATGSIQAYGAVTVADGTGYVALLGNGVENRGAITARGGRVVLAGGSGITLTRDATSGAVTALAVETPDKGVTAGGVIDVSSAGGTGGVVETAGIVTVPGDIRATAAGAVADGYWLLHRNDTFTIGSGGVISGESLSSILRVMDARVTSASDIVVGDAVSWSAHTLTLASAANVRVNNVMTVSGQGGFTATYGQNSTHMPAATTTEHHNISLEPPEVDIYGVVMARGKNADGSDNDTFVGKINFSSTGSVRMGVTGGTLKTYTVINSAGALASLNANTNYVLGSDIDLGGVPDWTPLAGIYNGSFDGFGHVVTNLRSTRGGLFAEIGGSYVLPTFNSVADYAYPLVDGAGVRNLGLVDVSINVPDANGSVGALAGASSGIVSNVFTTGMLQAATTNTTNPPYGFAAGGLFGTGAGIIIDSYSDVKVTSVNMSFAGGLLGSGYGYVRGSYATGDVSAALTTRLRYGPETGGFVGRGSGRIVDSYATGNVEGPGAVGGFVGTLMTDFDIFGSSSSGKVTLIDNSPYSLDNYAGGFIGNNWGSVLFSSSSGHVSSVTGNTDYLGGFAGRTVSSLGAMSIMNYFNSDTAGLTRDGLGNSVPTGMGMDGNTPILDAFNARYGTNLTPAQFHGGAIGLGAADFATITSQQQASPATAVQSLNNVMNGGRPVGYTPPTTGGGGDGGSGGNGGNGGGTGGGTDNGSGGTGGTDAGGGSAGGGASGGNSDGGSAGNAGDSSGGNSGDNAQTANPGGNQGESSGSSGATSSADAGGTHGDNAASAPDGAPGGDTGASSGNSGGESSGGGAQPNAPTPDRGNRPLSAAAQQAMRSATVSATSGVSSAQEGAPVSGAPGAGWSPAPASIDDNIDLGAAPPAETAVPQNENERDRRTASRRRAPGAAPAGYGASIRSIEVDGQKFDLERQGDPAPASGGATPAAPTAPAH
ncbi:two-partner secretion domain-containing protein [Xanthobacter sediminis]|uniref:two-partner secretion domain-containing protein n=1 Tax=Xanthobacter sediminis TaxID=3119926 RepID=UPI00372C9627